MADTDAPAHTRSASGAICCPVDVTEMRHEGGLSTQPEPQRLGHFFAPKHDRDPALLHRGTAGFPCGPTRTDDSWVLVPRCGRCLQHPPVFEEVPLCG